MTARPGWRQYQDNSAEFFRDLGLTAEVDATVSGARATHHLDVYVTFDLYGLGVKWVCENKLWRTRVTKQHVIALEGVMRDIGADRGFVLSESGFQPGAISMARDTNITLSSLAELRSRAGDDLRRHQLRQMLAELVQLKRKFATLSVTTRTTHGWSTKIRRGVEGTRWLEMFGRLSTAQKAAEHGLTGQLPTTYGVDTDGDTFLRAETLDDLVSGIASALEIVRPWIEEQEINVSED
jgi:hypothetical protein